jgi:acyl carrier protein
MVPSAFVVLPVLPLTVNGKVDRGLLPAPEGSRREVVEEFVAPRSAAEETIAGIWSRLLGVDRVGVHDNFFELGGHSLLATQVASRLRQAFDVEIPVRTIFAAPTIAETATVVASTLLSRLNSQFTATP